MKPTVFNRLSRGSRWVLCAALGLVTASALPVVAPTTLAPDFTLRTMDGPNMRLQEQRGRVVMINFWATRCGESSTSLQFSSCSV